MVKIQDLVVCGKTVLRVGNLQYIQAFGYIYVIDWSDPNNPKIK